MGCAHFITSQSWWIYDKVTNLTWINFRFFFREFQTKTPIRFLCRQKLNFKSLIQSSETLLVELQYFSIHIVHNKNDVSNELM